MDYTNTQGIINAFKIAQAASTILVQHMREHNA